MKKLYVSLLALAALAAQPQLAKADDWSYDFENFATLYGDHYANSSFDMTINGLKWHCHGVSYSKNEDYDWYNGTQSMELYGESKKDRSKGPEITVFQLLTPRDIGTVKFTVHEYNLHPASSGWQVSWIVEWSQDGTTWSKVGDSFQAGSEAQTVERTVNQKNAYVRIVRADYTTFDYKTVTSNSKITNFDDLTITDIKGGPAAATLTASKTEVDFGSLAMGKSKKDTVVVKYSGVEGAGKPSYKLDGTDTASFKYTLNQTAEGEDSLFITATAQHSGTATASIAITYGELTAGVGLTLVGTKPRPNILFSGGEGTAESPYLISSKEDLQELSRLVDEGTQTFEGNYFQMTNSIDMKSVDNFKPIGNQLRGQGADNMRLFKGNFDGGGYTITGLKAYYDTGLSVGLFGVIYDATIKNLNLTASTIKGASSVGGIVGFSQGTSVIENCHVGSDVTVSGTNFVAGICGTAMLVGKLTISQCTNAAAVTGNYAAGIMSANSQDGTLIERCGNTGKITVSEYDGGGIMALSEYASTHFKNCYNTGTLVFNGTQQWGGGILGNVHYIVQGTTKVTIENCYNAAPMTQNYKVAPIIPGNNVVPEEGTMGYNKARLSVTNCYYAADLSTSAETVEGVSPLTSASMKEASFLTSLNQGQPVSYWVFKDGVNQGYPVPEGTSTTTAIGSVNSSTKAAVSVVGGKIVVSGNVDSYQVYDLNGRRVDASVSAPGVYVVKIITNKDTQTVKVIKR